MSRRENVPGRVYIAVVGCTAVHAGPFPYSQAGSTFRTACGNASAARAGLGGIALVYDLKDNACPLAFLLQHCLELAPSRIERGFGHFGLYEFAARYVAHENGGAALNQGG